MTKAKRKSGRKYGAKASQEVERAMHHVEPVVLNRGVAIVRCAGATRSHRVGIIPVRRGTAETRDRLHPKLVKLDRKLVVNLAGNPRKHKLVSGVVRLCGELGAEVVAEGIETRD